VATCSLVGGDVTIVVWNRTWKPNRRFRPSDQPILKWLSFAVNCRVQTWGRRESCGGSTVRGPHPSRGSFVPRSTQQVRAEPGPTPRSTKRVKLTCHLVHSRCWLRDLFVTLANEPGGRRAIRHRSRLRRTPL